MFTVKGYSGNLRGLVEEALDNREPSLFFVREPYEVVKAAEKYALKHSLPYLYIPASSLDGEQLQKLCQYRGVIVVDEAHKAPFELLCEVLTLEKKRLIAVWKLGV